MAVVNLAGAVSPRHLVNLLSFVVIGPQADLVLIPELVRVENVGVNVGVDDGDMNDEPGVAVPAPGNIYVNLGVFARRFSTVSDRLSGSWCRFPESWRQDGANGEKTGKKREKMGEKWPKKSGGKLT